MTEYVWRETVPCLSLRHWIRAENTSQGYFLRQSNVMLADKTQGAGVSLFLTLVQLNIVKKHINSEMI